MKYINWFLLLSIFAVRGVFCMRYEGERDPAAFALSSVDFTASNSGEDSEDGFSDEKRLLDEDGSDQRKSIGARLKDLRNNCGFFCWFCLKACKPGGDQR